MTCSLSKKDRNSDAKTKAACKISITKLKKIISLPDSNAKEKKPNMMKRKSLSEGYDEKKKKKKKKQDSHEEKEKHNSFSAPLVIKEQSEHDSDAKEKKPHMVKRKSLPDGYNEKKKKKKQESPEKKEKHRSFSAPLVIKEPSEHDSDAKEKKPYMLKRKSLPDGYNEKKKKKKQESPEKKEKHRSFSAPLVIKEPSEHDSDAKQKKLKRKSTSESYDEKMKKPLIIDEEPEEFTTKMLIGESSRSSCGICFDLKTDLDMFKRKSCNHLFCVDCISKYVDSQLNNNVVKVTCPTPNCSAKLLPRHLQHILPKEFIDRWELAKYESKIALEQKTYCAFKDCSVLLVNDNDRGEVLTSCECPSCHRLFYAQCKVPWHAEMNCQEFQDLKHNTNEVDLDDKFLKLAKRNKWQRCPNCSIYVKRRSGCEHMKCRCKCNFCYLCGKKWKHGHLCKKRERLLG
ncbi:E3 ubiquitin-protein ligase RNF144A-like protein, putative [Medicago truncatula]|uniref:RBR-type E3 ubiquitin transferase n=1 Tax=Medicago truncatula TaxID=3880 RepID=A0A072TPS6_MEDTR|nr:E3 ubiquitin-protein ligase RNF144A-like protein, putative [Medicago truncatula]